MPDSLAHKFRADLDEVHRALIAVPSGVADLPWREGGWTRKQIVGHLLDSAANNRQRFVRAADRRTIRWSDMRRTPGSMRTAMRHQTWATLLGWWEAEHEILMAVVDRIPEEKL